MEAVGFRLGLHPWDIWRYTPQELSRRARVYADALTDERNARRFEVALVVAAIRDTEFGATQRSSAEKLYESIRFGGGSEPAKTYQTYSGSLSEQLEAHAKHLDEIDGNSSNS